MASSDYVKTPLMQQYNDIKSKHPEAILLFRVGDFYETFSDDAVKTASILGITLTRRANGTAAFVELAGFPYHSLETYLPKLVRAGQRVAICEQLEDPKATKSIVKRGVTELVTPGVTLSENVLENKENNYLACVHLEKKIAGVAFLDISTGEFFVAEGSFEYIDKLLASFAPKEVLFERSKQVLFRELFGSKFYTFMLDDWLFTKETGYERLLKQFDTNSLKGFGIQSLVAATVAASASLQYLDMTHHNRTQHITRIARIEEDSYVWLDKFTIRNLELLGSPSLGGKGLIDILDYTRSPMGARLLKRWVAMPLKDINAIQSRQESVAFFMANDSFYSTVSSNIKLVGDLERIISRVALGRIGPRDVLQLKNALFAMEPIKMACLESGNNALMEVGHQIMPCIEIRDRIAREIKEDPSNQLSKGNVIADGISADLDDLRNLSNLGKDYLLQMQQREIERTGISSLRVSYNNVFGYFFEVKNTHKDKVPNDWERKQTLVNAERYINPELKEYEIKILGAEEKIQELEQSIYLALILAISQFINEIQLNAQLVARLDCLQSFAEVAVKNKYTCPEINETDIIDIKQGRHPVIERLLPIEEPYIANDIYLDSAKQQIIIITGPNMAGKSALLRQTALIVLMAQIGSFVPASEAKIGYVDKIFTRVGASDNISMGESTFMVEMNEAAAILNNISHRSLVLFDELGRGTSTYDGISIAWAIVEHIHELPRGRAKTLFATHYHELNEMEKTFPRIKNFNVSVKESNNKVIFIRKLVRGGSEHSFGIHVAKMAGMPKSVVSRSNEILKELEKSNRTETPSKSVTDIGQKREGYQLSFFQLDDPILTQIRDEIKSIDINNLTPMEALNKLNEIKKIAGI